MFKKWTNKQIREVFCDPIYDDFWYDYGTGDSSISPFGGKSIMLHSFLQKKKGGGHDVSQISINTFLLIFF